MENRQSIFEILSGHRGGARSFVAKLDDGGLRHLSWSKISAVESCPYGYYLQYIKKEKLSPEPDYFVKGRAFHRAAQRVYRRLAAGRELRAEELHPSIDRFKSEETRTHLKNAVEVLVSNIFQGWEVLGVEKIFALDLGRNLPPCVGVIDLVLRKGKVFAVVDHKTGKDHWRQDPMQLAIYREHVVREYGAPGCRGFFDSYRWVNDLRRIRKPAFIRTPVRMHPGSWPGALERFGRGHKAIMDVEKMGEDSPGTGSCWMCAWKFDCPKAHDLSWW